MIPLTAAQLAALDQPNAKIAWFVRMDLPSGIAAYNSGTRDYLISGTNYLSTGTLGSVSAVEGDARMVPRPVRLTMSGLDPAFLAMVLNENIRNRPVLLSLGILDANEAVIDNLIDRWAGQISGASINWGQGQVQIETRAWVNIDRKCGLLYTDEDQQQLYPGDRFFEFLAEVADGKRRFNNYDKIVPTRDDARVGRSRWL